ncbi:hypothetical protein SAMN02745857_01945 [Andreprevotia lacus DSM 23236]|jgi:hypothetical protein|uniref:Tetratricopeptide repeat-containing protein n=1 Tax=Andreprevotia lacus DSM 23236 TaxID=1121001 RepID=A0A1W1XMH8_9NEIS|nr:hypothetical protein [Andreprevotia lacus]SMC24741.1 hypothetical protein SAMN02745857_01945 [Andreprevotia lacus DSM 23236]
MFKCLYMLLPATLLLAACGGAPLAPKPARLQAAEAAVLAANRATQSGADADASHYWREAWQAYASIDDWGGQGEARLGLANSLVRQGERDEAVRILASMRGNELFSADLRARATYQQALLQLATPDLAKASLAQARALCGAACGWVARLDNLQARLAVQGGDYAGAGALLTRVLAAPGLPGGERAHALRLMAEVALHDGALADARQRIDAAIVLDRQLAEPAYLVDDYVFLRRYAAAAGDEVLRTEAGQRLQSLCAVFSSAACSGN